MSPDEALFKMRFVNRSVIECHVRENINEVFPVNALVIFLAG